MTTSPAFVVDQAVASARVGELYEAHGRMVVGLCRFLLRDPVEAEDAAQQSFVAAHRSLLGGSEPRDAPAWLATIARNECRARIKRRMREPLVVLDPEESAGSLPDPFQAAVRRADLEALRDGLVALPPAQRHAFLLREFAGLTYDELAAALGVTGSAVESLLVRARMRLRSALMRVNPLFLPLVLRDQLARVGAGGVDEGSAGAITKIASLPLAAKLAAAGAGVALVAVGGSVAERHGGGDRVVAPPPPAVAVPDDSRGAPAVVAHRLAEGSAAGTALAGASRAVRQTVSASSVTSATRSIRSARASAVQATPVTVSAPVAAPAGSDAQPSGDASGSGEQAATDTSSSSDATTTDDRTQAGPVEVETESSSGPSDSGSTGSDSGSSEPAGSTSDVSGSTLEVSGGASVDGHDSSGSGSSNLESSGSGG